MLPHVVAIAVFLCAFVNAGVALSQPPGFCPVAAPAAEVLAFTASSPRGIHRPPWKASYLWSPITQRTELYWTGKVAAPHPIALGRHGTMLLFSKPDYISLHLPTGIANRVERRSALPCEILSASSGNAYAWCGESTSDCIGYKLVSVGRKNTVLEYPRQSGKLLRWSESEPTQFIPLTTSGVEKVLAEDNNGFWVLTSGAPRRLCYVGKDGTEETFASIKSDYIETLASLAVSPTRKYLALSAARKPLDFDSEREFVVIDLRTKAIVVQKVFTDPMFGSINNPWPLFMHWVSGEDLAVGIAEKQVFNARTGKQVGVGECQRLLNDFHERNRVVRDGQFFVERQKTFRFSRRGPPIATLIDHDGGDASEVSLSSTGNWLAASRSDRLLVAAGETERLEPLYFGDSFDVQWLTLPPEK